MASILNLQEHCQLRTIKNVLNLINHSLLKTYFMDLLQLMDLSQRPLSVTTVGNMTITIYPQLILIERGGHMEKYIGYSKTEAIKMFRKKYKHS
jgi:hypothetical protein